MPTPSTPKKRQLDDLACVYPNAAGLDIGSAVIVVAVPLIAILSLYGSF